MPHSSASSYRRDAAMRESQNLIGSELNNFRTQPCIHKALRRECPNGDDCPHSHCLSWCRRNPSEVHYRPGLCSFVIFRKDQSRTRVKNFCNRGRFCPHAHTKEEQMYHPMVYKTKLCRAYPDCFRVYCPFAHGIHELRRPDLCTPAAAAVADMMQTAFDSPYMHSPVSLPPWVQPPLDEPLSQPSYPSPMTQSIHSQNTKAGYSEGEYSDTSQCMEPLGNLVLGSDGHLYLRVIPTR